MDDSTPRRDLILARRRMRRLVAAITLVRVPAADETQPGSGSGPAVAPGTVPSVPRQRTDTDTDTELAASDTDLPTRDAGLAASDERPGLGDRERRILDFERQWWKHAGAKEQAIRDTFGISATRYYQLLNQLLDEPSALAAEPVLVARLRRLRAARSRARRR
ncbi:DUF3263 domain-containing protein [Solwaraspora sp. WMMD406]|uniref:DUF3263 domain-containing protein n=1 Tax=Solwaraspora sp. WMMD406 TaxID=3016095 RepID=UPI0024175215|nr:DUF3263 domain-containing protein [Solwaraspora sp. WMMD406]MDG4768294.1 DUF3263 domain-containing protein [Solwaraspora sp. WMMD406]